MTTCIESYQRPPGQWLPSSEIASLSSLREPKRCCARLRQSKADKASTGSKEVSKRQLDRPKGLGARSWVATLLCTILDSLFKRKQDVSPPEWRFLNHLKHFPESESARETTFHASKSSKRFTKCPNEAFLAASGSSGTPKRSRSQKASLAESRNRFSCASAL